MKSKSTLRFLIDENISPEVTRLFQAQGHIAHHINEMKAGKNHRVTDDRIRRFLLNHPEYVIVTRDDDFVKSYVDRKVPEKMIFVYGLDEKKRLLKRMEDCIATLVELLIRYDFVELNKRNIRTPFG